MASASPETGMKNENDDINARPRKRRFFECLYNQQHDTKFIKKEVDCGEEESQHASAIPRDAFRKSLESLHEYRGWLHWKENGVKENLLTDKRLKQKDDTIRNLKLRVKELELDSKTTDPDINKTQESLAVKNLLGQINRLQEDNDNLCNEVNRVRGIERQWASKYWEIYETISEKDKKMSRIEFEHAEKESQLKKLKNEHQRLLREVQCCKENQAKSEEVLRQHIRNMREEYTDIETELFEDKIRHLEFMANYKPMVIIENPRKSSIDIDHFDTVNTQISGMKRAFLQLKQEATDVSDASQKLIASTTLQIQNAVQETSDKYNELFPKYKREIELRKKYHNELVELRGNIRVLCRIRPAGKSSEEDMASCISVDVFDDCTIKVNNKGRCQDFEFDKVFKENTTQCQVFDEVSSLVTSVMDGFNVCIFAYGQTGAGKTYTMEGPSHNPGINQRALRLLFEKAQGSSSSYSIEASVMEVYNEVVRDLLNSDTSTKLEVKMKPEGGLHVPGLVHIPVTSLEEVNQIFSLGQRNRATEATNMNEHSSRSHCLLGVTVTGINKLTGMKTFGRLNLVDLAGSERVSKSLAEGPRLKEAQNINKSLSALGDVINALKNKHSHIPYRNSKLTYLLQESLSGDSKTLMILQVSPEEKDVSETACTLVFGQRVRTIELGAASKRIEEGKGTPSSVRRGVENAIKTTPTTGGRPPNLQKSSSIWGSNKLKQRE